MTKKQVATNDKPRSLVTKMAEGYGVDEHKLMATLKETAFSQGQGKPAPTNEQMMSLLIVADQYKLNPFTKEIYAFPQQGKGIIPVVSVDGWIRIINEHPAMDGIEFTHSEEMVQMDGAAHECNDWIECTIYRKDRSHPTVIREYIDEVYQPKRGNYAGPWQSHTKRFHRHKALIQCARVAFGFAGIYDQDEAARVAEGQSVEAEYVEQAAVVEPLVEDVVEVIFFADSDFDESVEEYGDLIRSGQHTAESLINMVESSGVQFDEDQVAKLKSFEGEEIENT
jgi:phage recombination protein Bet